MITKADALTTFQGLGKDNICKLFLAFYMVYFHSFANNIRTKMMEAYGKMFGMRAGFVIGGNFDATAVVFEDTTSNLGSWAVKFKTFSFQILHQVDYCDNFTKGRR